MEYGYLKSRNGLGSLMVVSTRFLAEPPVVIPALLAGGRDAEAVERPTQGELLLGRLDKRRVRDRVALPVRGHQALLRQDGRELV